VNVAADSTWNAQQLTVINQAISDACYTWNTQQTCGNNPYTCNPVTDVSVADVVVTRVDDQSTCAQTALQSIVFQNRSGSDSIQLQGRVANNKDSAARFIEHEFGHVSGLGNSIDSAQCAGANSIMSLIGPLDTCISSNVTVTASDEAQVGKSINSPSQCTQDVNQTNPEHADTGVCPSDNGCSGYDDSGYPIREPDYCQYQFGCPSGSKSFHMVNRTVKQSPSLVF
jgi:hypothetical protein